jgi:multiple sugar transport system permease protein
MEMRSTVPLEESIPAMGQTLARPRSRRKHLGPLAARRERWFYLMISPWFIGFILFQGGPIVASALLSLADWEIARTPRWVGLSHFATMLGQDRLFWKVSWNTLYYTLGSVPTGLVLAFLLALLLNERVRGVNIFRTIFFLPSVVSGVAVILLWGWIFNPKYGIINGLLAKVGIRGPGWLQDERWAMPALIIMSLWGVGWMMLIYLASLQSVPAELYEAAEMDGAGRWRRFRHITVPLVSPVTFFLLVTSIIGSFQIFTQTYVLTRGGPNNATLTIGLYIYLNAFQWNKMGYAAALAWVLFAAILLLTLIQFRLAGRWVYYEQEERR